MNEFDLHQIFAELADDDINFGSKLILTESGIKFIFLLNLDSNRRETCIQVSKAELNSQYPQWNGIELDITKCLSRGNNKIEGEFIVLKQVPEFDFDGSKYETIINDIFSSLYNESLDQSNNKLKNILFTWQQFFTKSNIKSPSKEEQQGLFGELLYLKHLISLFGAKAVDYWQGPTRSSHDFALSYTDAVEVKTSAKKAPYNITITNEYQLDSEEGGELFLAFYPLELSEREGESVPDIILDIEKSLDSDFILQNKFIEKLAQANYHKSYAELYNLRFKQRESLMLYHVTQKFPRISRKRQKIPNAVGSISYTLELGGLENYLISKDEFIQITKRLL